MPTFTWAPPKSYTVIKEPPFVRWHDMEFDGYFQDNWHVCRNLTVNLGLRYETHPAPWTKYDLTEGFDLKNDAMVLGAPPVYPYLRGLHDPDDHHQR